MSKNNYLTPQIEVVTLEVEGVILKPSADGTFAPGISGNESAWD